MNFIKTKMAKSHFFSWFSTVELTKQRRFKLWLSSANPKRTNIYIVINVVLKYTVAPCEVMPDPKGCEQS